MESQPSAAPEVHDPETTTYTVSLTARACLQALQFAAWIEAMIRAHRAAHPQGAGSWCWFLGRCVVLSLGAYLVVGMMAEIAKRRSARRPGTGPRQVLFDAPAFEALASALLFHFGSPLWLWIFA